MMVPVLSGSLWTRLAVEINADLGTSRIVGGLAGAVGILNGSHQPRVSLPPQSGHLTWGLL